jgi:two-component system invasion response regulator UvrY
MVDRSTDTAIRPIGVVIVDDQALFRQAARAVVDAAPGFLFLGEAVCGEDAVSLAAQLHPDLMLVDFRLPGISGLETCARLARLRPQPFVFLVSANVDAALPELAVAHGAVGFMQKHALRPQALRAMWEARYPYDSGFESSVM